MSTLKELKQIKELKINETLKKYGVFFAFSDKQFEENKTPLAENDKYTTIMSGGYCPKSQSEDLLTSIDNIDAEYWTSIETNNLIDDVILYELINHESFYDGDYSRAQEVIPAKYKNDVVRVYRSNYEKYAD